MRTGTRFAGVLGLVAIIAVPWSATAAVPDRDLARIVDRAFASGGSPGLSVAVVQGDHVWCGAWGVRDVVTGAKVTPGTRFYIASTTKALTALAAACLAGRGALDLDAPLVTALPGARFPRGYPADSVRVRDLLTHTHGLSADGPITIRVSYTGEYTNADLLRLLGEHAIVPGPRVFRYSNLGYELAALVMAPEGRDGWKAVVEREVLVPLGMRATTSWRSRVPDDSLASPHVLGPDGFERIRLAKEDANLGPAGGHLSTACDLARLVSAEFDHGRIDGRQALPRAVVDGTQRTRVAQDRTFQYFHREGWALGWDVARYGDERVLTRYGGFTGCFSHVSFMPDHRTGVVVLANGEGVATRLAETVAAGLYDRMLGRRDADSLLGSRLASLDSAIVQRRAAERADRARRAARQVPMRHPFSAYAGTYENDVLGTLELRPVDGGLEAVMGVARSRAEVFDPADRLRVELFGSGDVLDCEFGSADSLATRVRFAQQVFTRR